MAVKTPIVPFRPPSRRLTRRLAAPARRYFRPTFTGLEHIKPNGRYLFVGNHTLFGMLDTPLLLAQVYEETGLYLRALADKFHFQIPVWGDILMRLGGVEGTRENCAALMDAGQPILVFPGGAREVFKRKGEAHKLIWKERTGFARMAIEHQYHIIPFAARGGDDAFDIHLDAGDFIRSPLGRMLDKVGILRGALRGGDAVPPIATGIGLTPFPKRVPFSFAFGKPMSTRSFKGRYDEKAALLTLRAKVEAEVDRLQAALAAASR